MLRTKVNFAKCVRLLSYWLLRFRAVRVGPISDFEHRTFLSGRERECLFDRDENETFNDKNSRKRVKVGQSWSGMNLAQFCSVFPVGVELWNFWFDDIVPVGQIVSASWRKVGRVGEQSVACGRKEGGKIKGIGLEYCFSSMVISSQNSRAQDRIREIPVLFAPLWFYSAATGSETIIRKQAECLGEIENHFTLRRSAIPAIVDLEDFPGRRHHSCRFVTLIVILVVKTRLRNWQSFIRERKGTAEPECKSDKMDST